ncbi:MAG: hypothetical protein KGZ39_01295 [Simkania sp.]|nr:hypothetical protein [Simkania sp.]
MRSSISEDNGLAAILNSDVRIYSVGISTGGIAEIRMGQSSQQRKIIATTLDQEGATFAKNQIKKAGLSNQIEVKLEDIAHALPYPIAFLPSGYFN